MQGWQQLVVVPEQLPLACSEHRPVLAAAEQCLSRQRLQQLSRLALLTRRAHRSAASGEETKQQRQAQPLEQLVKAGGRQPPALLPLLEVQLQLQEESVEPP